MVPHRQGLEKKIGNLTEWRHASLPKKRARKENQHRQKPGRLVGKKVGSGMIYLREPADRDRIVVVDLPNNVPIGAEFRFELPKRLGQSGRAPCLPPTLQQNHTMCCRPSPNSLVESRVQPFITIVNSSLARSAQTEAREAKLEAARLLCRVTVAALATAAATTPRTNASK